jgi:hypothetical protein
LRRSLGLLSALLAAAPASAVDEDLPARLSLDWALERARERNPDVQAAQSRHLAMRERPSQAGALPDPSLGVRYHDEDWRHPLGLRGARAGRLLRGLRPDRGSSSSACRAAA